MLGTTTILVTRNRILSTRLHTLMKVLVRDLKVLAWGVASL